MPKNNPNTTGECEYCGKEFLYYLAPSHKDNPRRQQRFCSYECSTHKSIKSKSIIKPCLVCGKPISIAPSKLFRTKYCSKKCQYRSRSDQPSRERRVAKTCLVCQKVFSSPVSKAARRVCCSTDCAGKLKSNNPKNVWTALECNNCHNNFRRRTYQVAESTHHFCNRKCYREWQDSQRNQHHARLNCVICGKEFERGNHYVYVRKNAKCCSRRCLDRYNSINKRREKNVNWLGGSVTDYGPDWSWQKKQARKRDGNRCVLCGTQSQPWRLDIHHIVPFRSFGYISGENSNHIRANDLSNLVTLCKKCHRRVEHKPYLLHWLKPASAI